MKILHGNNINWCKRRLMSKLYMDHSVKLKLDQGLTKKFEDWKRS